MGIEYEIRWQSYEDNSDVWSMMWFGKKFWIFCKEQKDWITFLFSDEAAKQTIIDNTETNLITLRRNIYLTIQSSLDFEECAHKLLKMELKPGQEVYKIRKFHTAFSKPDRNKTSRSLCVRFLVSCARPGSVKHVVCFKSCIDILLSLEIRMLWVSSE